MFDSKKSLFFVLLMCGMMFVSPQNTKAEGVVEQVKDTYNRESTINEQLKVIGKPTYKIKIPGLSYTEVKTTEEDGKTYLHIPFIGEYLGVMYRYLIVLAGVVAVIVIIIAGIQWSASGGNSGTIESAKGRIIGALTGLGLAVGSYIILYTINPELVSFRSLKILYVEGIPVDANYEEGEIITEQSNSFLKPLERYYRGNPKPSGKAKCIYDKFTPNLKVGQLPSIQKIDMFNLGTSVAVNANSYDAWKKVSDEILASSDPEVIGYLQYMRDYKAKKVPDLLGAKDGQGVVSQSLGRGIGISRATGKELGSIIQDMHVMGLAVDFMTRSNWDINWGGTQKGKPASGYCRNYKATIEKMKKGDYGEELKSDPYKMYARLEKKIDNCLNKFAEGTDPFTSLPQGFIDVFTRNGFYWGGYGWGNRLRSDSMHFEYWGGC